MQVRVRHRPYSMLDLPYPSVGRQIGCADMSQALAIFDARFAVPVCWEAV